jgi:hypothetical protein
MSVKTESIEYMVKSINAKQFCMTKNDKIIGVLKYKNRFSFKAQMTMADASIYTLEPKGFFGNTIELKDNRRVLLSFKQNWKGKIVISAVFENFNRQFIFKHKGIFKTGYLLTDKDDYELAGIQPQFKLKKFNYDYIISANVLLDKFDYKEILLLTTIHCANFERRRNSAAAAT